MPEESRGVHDRFLKAFLGSLKSRKTTNLKNGGKWLFDKSVDKMISVINFREISIVRILLQIEVTVFRLIVEQLLALYTRIQCYK
jgi:hypothetical protein